MPSGNRGKIGSAGMVHYDHATTGTSNTTTALTIELPQTNNSNIWSSEGTYCVVEYKIGMTSASGYRVRCQFQDASSTVKTFAASGDSEGNVSLNTFSSTYVNLTISGLDEASTAWATGCMHIAVWPEGYSTWGATAFSNFHANTHSIKTDGNYTQSKVGGQFFNYNDNDAVKYIKIYAEAMYFRNYSTITSYVVGGPT